MKHLLKVDTMPTEYQFKYSTWEGIKPYVGLTIDKHEVFYNFNPLDEYVWAKDSDFEWKTEKPWNGAWHYIGKDDMVALPHVIQGKEVTSYRGMLYETYVIGVYSDNTNVTDMNFMFEGSKAETLDLSIFDTSNVTSMRGMFYKSQAKELVLFNLNTSKVTDMYDMFRESEAPDLDLWGFDTSSVTNMNGMFFDSKATSLDLSTLDTSNVTDMKHMFGKSLITDLDLSSFNTSKVTEMSFMFFRSQATSLDLSSFDTSNVTNMDGMFQNCVATNGYARTHEDADKFNSSSEKPSTLTFIVKP